MNPRIFKINAHRSLSYYTPEDVAAMLAKAEKLHDALAGLTAMLSHYTYSRENREALAKAREVLSQYQPAAEPTTDD